MGNGALQSNPTVADIDITTHASDWLWAVFAIMLVSDLAFLGAAMRLPVGGRVFYHIPIMLLTTASIAYFCMASDLGGVPIYVEFVRKGFGGGTVPTRSIWYVRYIDWTITTPLLLLELLLGTGLPLSDIITVVFMDLVMIVTGLIGSLVTSSYKWGFFVFGCAALGYVWWVLLFSARTSAFRLGAEAGRAYRFSAIYLSALWVLYPVAWGLCDGGNVISPTGEMIFYGILDVLAKPVFCAVHVYALRNVPYELYQLQSGKSSLGATNANGRLGGATTTSGNAYGADQGLNGNNNNTGTSTGTSTALRT